MTKAEVSGIRSICTYNGQQRRRPDNRTHNATLHVSILGRPQLVACIICHLILRESVHCECCLSPLLLSLLVPSPDSNSTHTLVISRSSNSAHSQKWTQLAVGVYCVRTRYIHSIVSLLRLNAAILMMTRIPCAAMASFVSVCLYLEETQLL